MSLLEIHCSKPECHWVGAPDDAADHPCPTPAEAPLVDDIPTVGSDGGPPLLATKDELERWLVDNGSYTATGEPADAATEQADRQYAQLVAAERDAATPPEPTLADDDDPPAPPEPEPLVETPTPAHTDEAWQITVAAQIRERDDARQIRWAIVDEDAAEMLAGHAIKAAAESDLIEWLHSGREATLHRISELLKDATDEAAKSGPGPLRAVPDLADDEPEPTPEPATEADPEPEPEPEPEPDVEAEASQEEAEPEPDEPEATTDEEAAPAGPATPALFDPADYDKPGLQIPKVDGHAIDRIAVDFTGGVMLDRSDPANVALYNRVHGRGTIELWVEAKWGGTAGKPATNRDGETDIIVGRKTLRVETIRIVDTEQLGALEGLELVRAAARKAARAGAPDDQIEAAVTAALAETG